MSENYIWSSIEEIPFNLDPAYLKEYGIEYFGQKKVDSKLLPYIDNSFYLYLIERGAEPFEFEYITFFNAMTHNLIEYDGKELKTYCVENYDLIDDDSKRDAIWYEAKDNECLPDEFYAYLEKYEGDKFSLQMKNVQKMFHQPL